MNTPPKDQDEFESTLRARRPFVPRFDDDDDAEPSPELDRIVIARARDSLRLAAAPSAPHTPGQPRRDSRERHYRGPRWAVPLALAATVMLSFVLVMQLDPARNDTLGESRAQRAVEAAQQAEGETAPMLSDTGVASDSVAERADASPGGASGDDASREAASNAAVVEEAAEDGMASNAAAAPVTPAPAAAMPPAAAPAAAAPATAAPPAPPPPAPPSAASADAGQQSAKAAVAAPADARQQSAKTAIAAPADARQQSAKAAIAEVTDRPVPAEAEAAANASPIVRPQPEAAARAMQQRDARDAAPGDRGRRLDAATQAAPADATAWLDEIERLRRDGDIDAARKQLAEFRRRFPDHPLPASLEALLR